MSVLSFILNATIANNYDPTLTNLAVEAAKKADIPVNKGLSPPMYMESLYALGQETLDDVTKSHPKCSNIFRFMMLTFGRILAEREKLIRNRDSIMGYDFLLKELIGYINHLTQRGISAPLRTALQVILDKIPGNFGIKYCTFLSDKEIIYYINSIWNIISDRLDSSFYLFNGKYEIIVLTDILARSYYELDGRRPPSIRLIKENNEFFHKSFPR